MGSQSQLYTACWYMVQAKSLTKLGEGGAVIHLPPSLPPLTHCAKNLLTLTAMSYHKRVKNNRCKVHWNTKKKVNKNRACAQRYALGLTLQPEDEVEAGFKSVGASQP